MKFGHPHPTSPGCGCPATLEYMMKPRKVNIYQANLPTIVIAAEGSANDKALSEISAYQLIGHGTATRRIYKKFNRMMDWLANFQTWAHLAMYETALKEAIDREETQGNRSTMADTPGTEQTGRANGTWSEDDYHTFVGHPNDDLQMYCRHNFIIDGEIVPCGFPHEHELHD